MGLFALPLYDDPKLNAAAAQANLRLYTSGEGGFYNLELALSCIQKAIEQEKDLNDKRSREGNM